MFFIKLIHSTLRILESMQTAAKSITLTVMFTELQFMCRCSAPKSKILWSVLDKVWIKSCFKE